MLNKPHEHTFNAKKYDENGVLKNLSIWSVRLSLAEQNFSSKGFNEEKGSTQLTN